MLLLEVLLENVVLILGQTRLHVAARLRTGRCAVWRRELAAARSVGVLHAGAVRVHPRRAATRQGCGGAVRCGCRRATVTSTMRLYGAQCRRAVAGEQVLSGVAAGLQGRAISR